MGMRPAVASSMEEGGWRGSGGRSEGSRLSSKERASGGLTFVVYILRGDKCECACLCQCVSVSLQSVSLCVSLDVEITPALKPSDHRCERERGLSSARPGVGV